MKATSSPVAELGEREAGILAGLLETYFAQGQPVGSRVLAERSDLDLSSATIRHVLAVLDTEGYLHQPHTSAGRVPTLKALRWWVQRLHDLPELSALEIRDFEHALRMAGDESELWTCASQYLSRISHQCGVVAVHPWQDTGIKKLCFVRITERRVLVLLVGTDGSVRERVCRVPETYSQPELDAAAAFICRNFSGASLARVRSELNHRVTEERSAYDELLRRVLVLYHSGVLALQDSGQLFFEGAAHLAGLLDGDRLGRLLSSLNQKERWLELLAGVVEAGGPDGAVAFDIGGELGGRGSVRVRVGLEAEQLPECSLITTTCEGGGHACATLAVFGSTRMEYERALRAVFLVRDSFSRVLGEN